MSIATVLLLVGAIGIMLVMHFVGHGSSHRAPGVHGADVPTPAPDQGEGAAGASKEPAHRGHGCC